MGISPLIHLLQTRQIPCAKHVNSVKQEEKHTPDTGSISLHHNSLGAGVSAKQMEAGYPGRMLTTRGFPSTQQYKFCNFKGGSLLQIYLSYFSCFQGHYRNAEVQAVF
jgi:hypothetical protein